MPSVHDSIQIGSVVLRNRILLPPHQPGLASGGQITEKYIEYHRERARAGIALQITGATPVAPSAEWSDICLWNIDDSIIPGYKALGEAVRAEGGRMLAQLAHPGPTEVEGAEVIGPSRDFSEVSRQVAVEASADQLERIVNEYARAAQRCRLGQLDGVEISMAHGLLLAAFLSPLTNHRHDQFGGSFEGRLELPRRVLRATRAAIGPDMILGIRIGADDLVEGGLKPADAGQIVAALEPYVDYVSVMVGNNNRLEARTRHWPPTPAQPGLFRPVFREVKEWLPNTPVIGVGRVLDLELADEIVRAGDADLVGMVRAHIADPELLPKSTGQTAGAVRPCIGANVCVNTLMLKKPLACMVNPDVGSPNDYGQEAVLTGWCALVIGGGPAGLEAARRLAEQGSNVTLWERRKYLGGQLADWSQAPVRQEFARWLAWQEGELARLRVDVQLSVDADIAQMKGARPDVVVLATGSTPVDITVPSDGSVEIITAEQLFSRQTLPSAAVVYETVGELDGPILVDYLQKSGVDTCLATSRIHVGEGDGINTLVPMLRHLSEAETNMLERVTLAEIRDGHAIFQGTFGGAKIHRVLTDLVVAWGGGVPRDELYPQLLSSGYNVVRAGDVLRPRRITDAVADAKSVVDEIVQAKSAQPSAGVR